MKTRDFWLWLFGVAGLLLLCLGVAYKDGVWRFQTWIPLAILIFLTFVYLTPAKVRKASAYLNTALVVVWVNVRAGLELSPFVHLLFVCLAIFFIMWCIEEVREFLTEDFRERQPLA